MQISYTYRDSLSCLSAVTELSDHESREDYGASTCHAFFQAFFLQYQKVKELCNSIYMVKSHDKLSRDNFHVNVFGVW
jgi:hypothetical protein